MRAGTPYRRQTLALIINNEYVGDDVFAAEFSQLEGLSTDGQHPASDYELRQLRHLAEERVVGRVLLRQRATANGITVDPTEIEARRRQQWGTSSASVCGAGALRLIGENLLIEKYCNWIARHVPRPSRTEVEALYRSRRESLRIPEQVNLMHVTRNIYLPEDEPVALATMESAEQQLKAGTLFQKVADRVSDCGGRTMLGWVKRGEMVQEFEDVAFTVAKGQRSGIFRTMFGLHIVHVKDRRPAGYQPFEEARAGLARELLERRRDLRLREEVSDAMRVATILPPLPAEDGSAGRG